MPNPDVDLSTFSNPSFDRGAPRWKEFCWIVVSDFFPASAEPVEWRENPVAALVRAKVGKSVLLKPQVQIKFPWKLRIGDHTWIGENVWIDNLASVHIGSNVCISQGAYIFTGNHDYKKTTFDLIIKPVVIENGAWIGAKAIVCPGVTVATHAVLAAGSVATSDAQPYSIYQGNPAVWVRERKLEIFE